MLAVILTVFSLLISAFALGARHGSTRTAKTLQREWGIDSLPAFPWRKSPRSGHSDCVEVAVMDGEVAVRDSKNRQGPVLRFTPSEWAAFIAGVEDGEFRLP